MSQPDRIYVLGSGAVGFPLAAHLINVGRDAVAVRTSRDDLPLETRRITVLNGEAAITVSVPTVSLAQLPRLDGTIVLAAKAHANAALAPLLAAKAGAGPVVVLQNGIGVEQPLRAAGLRQVYRCVLYVTAQTVDTDTFLFRSVTASPIGSISGDQDGVAACVARLSTEAFPFRAEPAIEREVWKKAIINTAFNSICPLLDADNGVFVRDPASLELARLVVQECLSVTARLGMDLGEQELIDQILVISRPSAGQLISTLQDIRAGRQTEIAFLNLAIARTAAALEPPLDLPRVALLGQMIAVKSAEHMQRRTAS